MIHHLWHPVSLTMLQRIKKWHVAHKAEHPCEYQLLDWVLILWVMSWVGWLPAIALDEAWLLPLCLLGMTLPNVYIGWRVAAHNQQRLRCDWLNQLG